MTFDVNTLVALLVAFYSPASLTRLHQGFAEHPEWFGGGRLIGSKGDKLQLPDGTIWDLLFAAGGPAGTQRYQALFVDPNAPVVDDPFALDAGPLTIIDDPGLTTPTAGGVFVDLVGRELGAAPGAFAAIDAAYTQAAGVAGVQDALEQDPGLDDAVAAAAAGDTTDLLSGDDPGAALDALSPTIEQGQRDSGDVSAATDGLSGQITTGRATVPPDPTQYVPEAPNVPPMPPEPPGEGVPTTGPPNPPQ